MENEGTTRRRFVRNGIYLLGGALGWEFLRPPILGIIAPSEESNISETQEIVAPQDTSKTVLAPKNSVDWKNLGNQEYLQRVADISGIPQPQGEYAFSQFVDKERQGRGFMRLQVKDNTGDLTEYIDFEKDGFLINFRSFGRGLFARKGEGYEGAVNAIVNFPQKNFKGDSRAAREVQLIPSGGEGGRETYQRGTEFYKKGLLHLASFYYNSDALTHWNVGSVKEAIENRLPSQRMK
ncbi:MAG: hypothetical protein KJ879_00475 [Nanoarchaeota archaeon]|nr:hypothetical protein [Nanoarchaeota archaeon]